MLLACKIVNNRLPEKVHIDDYVIQLGIKIMAGKAYIIVIEALHVLLKFETGSRCWRLIKSRERVRITIKIHLDIRVLHGNKLCTTHVLRVLLKIKIGTIITTWILQTRIDPEEREKKNTVEYAWLQVQRASFISLCSLKMIWFDTRLGSAKTRT